MVEHSCVDSVKEREDEDLVPSRRAVVVVVVDEEEAIDRFSIFCYWQRQLQKRLIVVFEILLRHHHC